MERSKHLTKFVGISALLVAGSAAFFSVFGLSNLFAGAKLSVVVMAGSLEFGKLVAASFLYRFWDNINRLLKIYLVTGVIILVGITSAGIFGYLSNAYQGATVNFEKQSTELLALEDRLDVLQEDRVFLKQELEDQVLSLPENYITAKRNLREQYNPQIQEISNDILNIKGRISDLEIELIETGVDVGPAIYLAKAFETDVDTVVKFFIFILIFVFDPLAVSLVLAFNHALQFESKVKETKIDKIYKSYKKSKPKTKDIEIETPKVIKSDSKLTGRGGIKT
tara:strand:- start:73 stop:915 length:843 start_codon:yes stop_codon:yes gene_type:complete